MSETRTEWKAYGDCAGECWFAPTLRALAAERNALRAALRDVIGMLDDPTGAEHVRDMRGATVIARAALNAQGKASGDAFGAGLKEYVQRLEAERDALRAEKGVATHWAITSPSGMHIGLWNNYETAKQVHDNEVNGSSMTPMRAISKAEETH